jgi:DNA-binding CsgD family transcriptional regulator
MGKPRQAGASRSRSTARPGERQPQSGTHRIDGKSGHPGASGPRGDGLKGREDSASPTILETPPAGLCSTTFRLGADQYALLSFPVRALELPADLTRAEREVVLGVLAGKSNQEIARERGTSAYTVMNQLTNVFRKLEVNSRWELIAWCGRNETPPKKR